MWQRETDSGREWNRKGEVELRRARIVAAGGRRKGVEDWREDY